MLLIVCNQKKPWSILSVLSTTYTGSKDDKGILPRQLDTEWRVQNLQIVTNFP